MPPNLGIAALEEVLSALSSARRRGTLYYLQEHEVATVDELAEQIVAWETDARPGKVDSDRHEAVVSELVHRHLPELADKQFIQYDPRSGRVVYTEPPMLLEKSLKFLASLEQDDGG